MKLNKIRKTVFSFFYKRAALFVNILLTVTNIVLFYQANRISSESWRINQFNLGFEIDTRSQNYVREAYDNLYLDQTNFNIMEKIKDNQIKTSSSDLLKVIDIFEEIGSDFCQGTAKSRHIKIYLQKSLSYICDNQIINQEYGGKKNGLSILCYEYYPDSKFSKMINMENINTCEFIDSSRFPKTGNKDRFVLE